MKFVTYFLRHKPVTLLLLALVLAGGLFSYVRMGKLEDAPFTIKQALVLTSYPGASSAEVQTQVTDLLEEAIQSLGELYYLKTENRAGLSKITVYVKKEIRAHEMQQLWDKLRRKVNDVQGKLPAGAVHDGVRPFVTPQMIDRCFEAAKQYKAAIPVVPMVDSLRERAPEGGSHPVDRSRYVAVQTPQVFALSLLKQAYEQPFSEQFTDDASVVEAMGESVAEVEGLRENIKVTTPFDLIVAQALFQTSAQPTF